MSEMGISQVLAQMRALQQAQMQQASEAAAAAPPAAAGKADFAGLLRDSVEQVNATQQTASQLSAAFEAEDPNVDLAQVMVALEKSSVTFQAMTQVRTKLVAAYQEIMNMSV
jgi:flagellar hook-basal body complex protein FliE